MRASAVFEFCFLALAASLVHAANVNIIVGGNEVNSTTNATTTFSPQRVTAASGDVVVFSFTAGNHSATQSTFASPCEPAHVTNLTINGFDSGFRSTDNGTAVTTLQVTINDDNVGQPIWFYDATPGACGEGAVGVINSNESSLQTLAGFIRNAIRLNGTATSTSSQPTATSATGTSSSSTSTKTSDAQRVLVTGAAAPLTALAFLLAFL